MADEDGPWVGAAELGEYAFCPRAHWYGRTQADRTPEDPRSRAGRAFHDRSLGAVARRQDRSGAYAALAAALLILLLSGLVLLGGLR